MAIYTKTGDKGSTSLANGQRVLKTDARIEAYGTVDELNSFVGLLRCRISHELSNQRLEWIQHRLFNLGALLSEAQGEWLTEADVRQLEEWIDDMTASVAPQRGFIIPYGVEAVNDSHVCRTVCRRAERRMIEAEVSGPAIQFVNRLSDFFFVFARYTAHLLNSPELEWKKDFEVEKMTEK